MSERTVIESLEAPAAIGPYSQAVVAGGFVFVSGQVGLRTGSTALVSDDVAEQTRQVLANVTAILRACGTSLDRVVQATIYVTNIADFGDVNAVYGKAFPEEPPARATVAVAALPLGAKVEIAVTAMAPAATE